MVGSTSAVRGRRGVLEHPAHNRRDGRTHSNTHVPAHNRRDGRTHSCARRRNTTTEPPARARALFGVVGRWEGGEGRVGAPSLPTRHAD
eukprot:7081417-Prymnesium_polylepis.1